MRPPSPRRWLLATLGVLCVALGAIGVIVPGLPTTVFLLAASWCFVRSCPWLEDKLLRTRFFAPYMRFIDSNEPMPPRARIIALVMMWTCITLSATLTRDRLWLTATILAAGVIGTVTILRWRQGAVTARETSPVPAGT